MRKWRKTHKLFGLARIKDIARHYARVYVVRGKIKKTGCEICGKKNHLHAHHEDYSKPLAVRWFCEKHHLQLHGKLLYLLGGEQIGLQA